jgi:F0F1-type ATP synthase membrane subunit b/b'
MKNPIRALLERGIVSGLALGVSSMAWAEETALEHELVEIPWSKLVIPQIVNFAIFVGLLIYLLRKPLKSHFEGKATEFAAARVKAEESKAAAERHHYDVQVQLRKLEQNFEKSLAEAGHESAALRERLIAEAKLAAQRQAEDAEAMTQFEYDRALAALRLEIVNASTQQAAALLNKRVDDDLRSKLNDDFMLKVKPLER